MEVERAPILAIAQQHAEEAAMLRHIRAVLVRAPHVRLHQLRRLDDRIAAHLDGLAVAGRHGTACCVAALERPGFGEVFALAVRSIEARDDAWLAKLFALCAVVPDAKRALLAAFGWVSGALLQGIGRELLVSPDALAREVGIAACRMHQVDPGPALAAGLRDTNAALRAAALRAAGELGRTDLLDHARAAMDDGDDENVVFWAAWSACLLGDRRASLTRLGSAAASGAGPPWRGLRLVMQAAEPDHAREIARSLVQGATAPAAATRLGLRLYGLLGDPRHVPSLIEAMADPASARLAGESFSLITGADLAALDLERKPPEGIEFGPNDDPEDDNVALDEDDSLPWPDPVLVQRWWRSHASSFQDGGRYFVGAPPGVAPCERVLRDGFQRQRLLAAEWLCVLEPGRKLFATAAPAWRQQRRLAAQAQETMPRNTL